MTFEEAIAAKHTGVVIAPNEAGNVVLIFMLEGAIEFGQEMAPTNAAALGRGLVDASHTACGKTTAAKRRR